MKRDDELKAKSVEVQSMLSRWAVRKGLLRPGEVIQVTAVVEKRPPVSVSIYSSPAGKSGKRVVLRDGMLSVKDWRTIRSTAKFTSQQRAVFEKLHRNDNEPVSTSELSSASVVSDMNRRLSQAALPYRISQMTRGGSWHDKKLKFYHVASK